MLKGLHDDVVVEEGTTLEQTWAVEKVLTRKKRKEGDVAVWPFLRV